MNQWKQLICVLMTDVFSKAKRSEVMSSIRSQGNKQTEIRLIVLMRKWHITGWRRNYPLYGKPDFVFPQKRLAVFVDGCFWHRCPKHGNIPSSNSLFWEKKLYANQVRDRKVTMQLKEKGWRVLRIWEHELLVRNENRLFARMQKYVL